MPLTTDDLCKLTGYSRAALTGFTQSGVIKPLAPNVWGLENITRLIAHLRERGQRPENTDHSRFEKSRADRERLRLLKETNEVCYVSDFDATVDQLGAVILKHSGAMPSAMARYNSSDRGLLRHAQEVVRTFQSAVAADSKALADNFGRKGNAT